MNFDAIASGNLAAVTEAIRADPSCVDAFLRRTGDTALHVAAVTSEPSIVDAILAAAPHAKYAKNFAGRTAFAEAVLYENVDAIEKIFRAPGEQDVAAMRDKYGYLPIHMACIHAKGEEVVRAVAELSPSCVTALHYGKLPIQMTRDVDAAKYLLRAAPETLRAVDSDGNTLLHLAVSQYWPEEVANLYLDPDLARTFNDDGELPIHAAARTNRHDLVPALLRVAPETTRSTTLTGATPLHEACKVGMLYQDDTAVVELLVAADPGAARVRDAHSHTPLYYATQWTRVVKKLSDVCGDMLRDLESGN
jgi:ankyrin repeat protein